MFGLRKKNSAEEEGEKKPYDDKEQEVQLPEEELEVHTMPKKFVAGQTKAKKKKPKLLMVLIAIVVILLLSVGAALLFRKIIGPDEVVQPTNLVANDNLNTANGNQSADENANSSLNGNANANLNGNLNTNSQPNSNDNENANADANLNRNRNFNTNAKIPIGQDSDGDELTDTEEGLYGTELGKPDTDSDGYVDGAEVKAGYSPIGPGRLGKTTLVKQYTNNSFGYTANYPAGWLADATSSDNSEVVFSPDEGVEFIQIITISNDESRTVKEWYLNQFKDKSEEDIYYVSLNPLLGIINPDGQTVYVATDNYIFTINYNTGQREDASYFATFEMMYKTFSLVPQKSTNTNSNANLNTNTNSNTNENGNLNSNANKNSNSSYNSNSNSNRNSNSNLNQNSNSNQNTNTNANQNTNRLF